MDDIKKFTTETVEELDKLKGVQIERAKLGPCPICGREITENRKGYSCWSRDDPGCGFVIWKRKAGKSLPVSVAKELIESLRASRERGEDPGVGRTEKAVTGFRSRAGRTFRAKLRLEQNDEGKWRVEFDEDWAKEPPAGESEEERAETEATSDGAAATGDGAGKAAAAASGKAAAKASASDPDESEEAAESEAAPAA
jgi:DNA topoisomerase-3